MRQTRITSVSLTKDFSYLCEKYQISPTEAIRKGIGIELAERGIKEYRSETNKRRSELIKSFLNVQLSDEKNLKMLKALFKFSDEIQNFKKYLDNLNKSRVELQGSGGSPSS